jgi:aspartyl protease family protein
MGAWVALVLLLVAGGALLLRGESDTIAGFDASDVAIVIAGIATAIFVGSTLLTGYRGRTRQALRDAMVWLVLAFGLVAGYSFREDILAFGHRIAGELAPPGSITRADVQQDGERAVRIRRRPDGHYIARTVVNSVALTMLVDTGASTVVLRPADARTLGIDMTKLRFTVPVQTANGTTYAAHVRLKRLSVGSIGFNDVEALVAKPGALKDSLLGMSFLNRLKSYEFSGEFLTLRI